jgi:hypothetical protein
VLETSGFERQDPIRIQEHCLLPEARGRPQQASPHGSGDPSELVQKLSNVAQGIGALRIRQEHVERSTRRVNPVAELFLESLQIVRRFRQGRTYEKTGAFFRKCVSALWSLAKRRAKPFRPSAPPRTSPDIP